MYINIIEDDLISNIQHSFREVYPYLKLQFYKNPHPEGQASSRAEQLDPALPIAEVTMFHTGGGIDINPERTVAEVEADFFSKLGLCVQVTRQAGDIWLTTTDTDHWTLREQNEKGREHSTPITREEPGDFGLSDVD
jgi:hypothetical protein